MTDKKEVKPNEDMTWQRTPITEDTIKKFRIMLETSELNKDKSDLDVWEYEQIISKELPKKELIENIEKSERLIAEGHNDEGKVLSPIDIEYNKILVEKKKKLLELDVPMRSIRLKLRDLQDSKTKLNSEEMQIPKIKKAIRNKFIEELVPKNNGKGYMG